MQNDRICQDWWFSVLAAVEKPQVVRISASKWLSPLWRSELNLDLCHEWSRFLHWTFWCIAATKTQNIPAKALSYHSIMKRASASICWCHKRDASKAYDTADDASNLSKNRYSNSEFKHKKHSVVSPTNTYSIFEIVFNCHEGSLDLNKIWAFWNLLHVFNRTYQGFSPFSIGARSETAAALKQYLPLKFHMEPKQICAGKG